MIKLKNLLVEIQHGWSTKPGTPDEVINAIHDVTAEVISKGKNPNDYIGLVPGDVPGLRKIWIVKNRKNHEGSLIFSEYYKQWYSPKLGIDEKAPINPTIMKAIIKQWVKD